MSYIDKDVKRAVEIMDTLLSNMNNWNEEYLVDRAPELAIDILCALKGEIIKRQTIETTCEGSE